MGINSGSKVNGTPGDEEFLATHEDQLSAEIDRSYSPHGVACSLAGIDKLGKYVVRRI